MSAALPDWLPEEIDTDGLWDDILARLYEVFDQDFTQGRPRYGGVAVWWDRRFTDGDPHEEAFWHLTTREDKTTGNRLIDTPRAKRLRWCRATIDNAVSPDVLAFDYEEGNGKIRTYLWVHEADYVVILEKKEKNGRVIAYSLVTAFVLDGPSRRKDMQRKYDNRKT
jgi:hypothetical protein